MGSSSQKGCGFGSPWALLYCWAVLLVTVMLRMPTYVEGEAVAPQQCNAKTSRPCPTMVGYEAPVTFDLSVIANLFSLNTSQLLGPNDIDPSLGNHSGLLLPASSGRPYLIPELCGCLGGQRVVTSVNYTIVEGDTLSAIAARYLNLVTYQKIANVSGISNPDLIYPGQELLIPIPCSCLNQSGSLSLSYQINTGDNFTGIAQLYNVSVTQLEDLNAPAKDSDLQAEDVLFVPLRVCTANFSNNALDQNMTVVEGAYELTAGGCVQCNCHNGTLHCIPASFAGTKCPNMTCQNSGLLLGERNSTKGSGGCAVQSCVYKGFTSTSRILSSLETEEDSSCPAAPPPEAYYKPPADLSLSPVGSPPETPSITSNPPPDTGSTSSPPPGSGTASLSSIQAMLSALWWCYLLVILLVR
ncbi:hypothetical protein KP509_21G002800 [Ceratopteris richardii]|uniref:LysM domain-containing protein n=1 Tax=Ceratopteris richardii TaxID=49495 RepID=A0A8T2S9Y8_CERRI|nr:hypothetical protein KP509_21G002800 [Ceratopteris richardii]